MSTYEAGRCGENYACTYLLNNGYEIIARNWRSPYGEIDIIAREPMNMVFIEVKMRRSLKYGFPYESVNRKKYTHLIKSILCYLEFRKMFNIKWQLDVLSIYNQQITHYKNISLDFQRL